MTNRLSTSVAGFFSTYLTKQRNLSRHTILCYRDAFKLFFKFLMERGVKIDRLKIEDLNKKIVEEFLFWLSSERNSSASTINKRLQAICSYVNYVKYDNPCSLASLDEILSIPEKKGEEKIIEHLTEDQIKTLFSTFDTSSPKEFRHYVILRLMYETGARVQEIINLSIHDYSGSTKNPSVNIFGKGRKYRTIPLDSEMSKLLNQYIAKRKNIPANQKLFFSSNRGNITRQGIQYIINKYAERAHYKDNSFPKHIHCHMLRHSKAFQLLANDVPLIVIRDFLGHSSVQTTEIYARADIGIKKKALAKVRGLIEDPDLPDWENCPDVMEFLTSFNVK